MNMTKMFIALAWVCVATTGWTGESQAQISADDFLPPVQGGTSKVQQPDKVQTKGDSVTAATAQDAMNAAVKANTRDQIGARMVQFPSGLGFVATGSSSYRQMDNPTATRIAKRKAYVIAFTQAKKNLAEMLGGLSNEGQEEIRESLLNVNLPDDEMTNIKTSSKESLKQSVEMMLRGFVVYEVSDDPKRSIVTVSIVTTPKTRGKHARPAANAIEAEDLREGLNEVIAEIKSGVVPPVGGRVIIMKKTGETALVGFGSTVVRSSENPAVQAKLNLTAQKVAGMHAKDALCGLMIGDNATWSGSVVESVQDEVQEFEVLAKGDPLSVKNPAEIRKLEHAKEQFIASIQVTDTYRMARKGMLPPGVTTRTWFTDDNGWAYAISVYVPSMSKAASQAADEIRGTNPKVPGSNGFRDDNIDVERPSGDVKQGPTGKPASDDDL